MPKLNISKQILINAPVDKVYSELNNFKNWINWSPWLIAEPNAILNYSEDEKHYSWEGKRVGIGEMTIVRESANESVHYDLTFLKPWKSKAKVQFNVKPQDEATIVTWSMDSSLPFFLFFMKKMMTVYIGNDYSRGLNMLKDYIELGKVESQLNFLGERNFPGCKYIGIKRTCSIDDMPNKMKEDFTGLGEFIRNIDEADMTKAFSIYHKFDMVKKMVSYTAGIPIKHTLSDLPEKYIVDAIPSTKIYTLEHVGRYDHLGNAWATLHMMIRNKEIKIKKNIHPFETYGNSPMNTKPQDLIAHINFAVK